MNYLIISNGYGEDAIGSKLIETINEITDKENNYWVMPIVGYGNGYRKDNKINILGPNRIFKSGGFLRNVGNWFSDIIDGLITHHINQIRSLKKLFSKIKIDNVICVGDFFLVLVSWLAFKRKIYFLPTAKSDYFQKHLWVEKYFIKNICKRVFTRDEITCESFREFGIEAYFFGNVLMDVIEDDSKDIIQFNKNNKNIIILPGSRDEAYKNLEKIKIILGIFQKIIDSKKIEVSYYIAMPESLDENKVINIISNPKINIVKGRFKTLVENADLIIGLSGTANEQAFGMGKPVIAFEGYGPQTTKKRFLEQKKLLGSGLIFVEGNPEKIAADMFRVLYNEDILYEIQQKAKVYMGMPGAIKKIAEMIVNETI